MSPVTPLFRKVELPNGVSDRFIILLEEHLSFGGVTG